MKYYISSNNKDVYFNETGDYYPASHLFTPSELSHLGNTRSSFIPIIVSRNKTFISFATRHIVDFEGAETISIIYENGASEKYAYQVGIPWYNLVDEMRKEISKKKIRVERIEVYA